MESLMDMDNISGQMVAILKESLKMDFEMVKVSGKRILALEIIIKGNIWMIKSTVPAFLNGKVVMFIRVIIKLIWGMATGKCIGMMVAIIKGSGIKVFNMEKGNYMFQDKDIK